MVSGFQRTSTFVKYLIIHFTRRLFRRFQFVVLFLAGAVATFPLFVPPFFLPLYGASLGLSASAGAGLVAGFNFSSAVGRLGFGFMSDVLGPLNTLFLSLLLSATSMLVLWPASSTLAPLIAFVAINGAANGGFFSTMPTVVGSVFGSARVSVAMGMIVTGWAGGYLMVRSLFQALIRGTLLMMLTLQRGRPLRAIFLQLMAGSTVR
jgi:MFS family permease